ncbi:hypothetical protein DFH27DRAFT_553376 [Peziza echinospora]|nr:hypothetical protein DFH27DRAFT_553376 [Peziza echinospora]
MRSNLALLYLSALAILLLNPIAATIVSLDRSITRKTDGRAATQYNGKGPQGAVAGLAAAGKDTTEQILALARHAALGLEEMVGLHPDKPSRPKMVAALCMNIYDPAEPVYVQSSLKGVTGGTYAIEQPLHPALESTFNQCVEEAKARDGVAPAPAAGASAAGAPPAEGDWEVVRGKKKAQAKASAQAAGKPKGTIKNYSEHGNSAACAEVLAVNAWLYARKDQAKYKTLSALNTLLSGEEYKGKKRIVTVNYVANKATPNAIPEVYTIEVADPCKSRNDDKKGIWSPWGCEEWLSLAGFEATCEVGHRFSGAQKKLNDVTPPRKKPTRRRLAKRTKNGEAAAKKNQAVVAAVKKPTRFVPESLAQAKCLPEPKKLAAAPKAAKPKVAPRKRWV